MCVCPAVFRTHLQQRGGGGKSCCLSEIQIQWGVLYFYLLIQAMLAGYSNWCTALHPTLNWDAFMGAKNYFLSISQHSETNVPAVKTRSSPKTTGIPCHVRPQVTLNALTSGEYCSWECLYCKENLTVVSRRQFEASHCDVIWRPAGWPNWEREQVKSRDSTSWKTV